MNVKIDRFRGKYFFLSNFYDSPVIYESGVYKNAESAYQAQKSGQIEKFFNLSPLDAKKLGNELPLCNNWEKNKDNVMLEIVLQKFKNNETIREKLLDTGKSVLEEGNTWGDTYWGTVNGKGRNQLGKILMTVREILRETE